MTYPMRCHIIRDMQRVVLDTCVLASAMRSRHGASFRCIQLVAERRLVALVTTALFIEYEDVLLRPEQQLAHRLPPAVVEAVLAELAALCEPVDTHFRWRPQLSDPADEMVIDAAINGRADALVTHNIGDFRRAAARFALPVLRPRELLERIR